jgi:hypothetical protein
VWNQLLEVNISEEDLQSGDATILIAIINHTTKRKIAQFEIPADRLVPTEQYNLEMALNCASGNSRLYISLTMRDRPQTETALLLHNPHLTRLEVLLKGITLALPQAAEENVAVAKVVRDADSYVQTLRSSSAASTEASFPLLQFKKMGGQTSSTTAFDTPSRTQVSGSAGPNAEPVWNQNMYFTYATADCGSSGAAVVIEYYQRGVHVAAGLAHSKEALRHAARAADQLVAPPPEMLVGYSVVSLARLMAASAEQGCLGRKPPTLHVLDTVPVTLLGTGGLGDPPQVQLEIRAWDASCVEIENQPKPPKLPSDETPAGAEKPAGPPADPLVERLLKEIDEKTDVIRRCGVEIIELRKQGAQLAAHNSDLRTLLEQEKTVAAVFDRRSEQDDWGSLKQAELLERSQILRQKYRGELQANEKLVQKLQLLQNAVMKRNAAEERLRELEDAHARQSHIVGKLREENRTVQKYKQTTREQEMVIEKLEVLLETALLDKQKLQKQLDEHAVCSVRPESAGY